MFAGSQRKFNSVLCKLHVSNPHSPQVNSCFHGCWFGLATALPLQDMRSTVKITYCQQKLIDKERHPETCDTPLNAYIWLLTQQLRNVPQHSCRLLRLPARALPASFLAQVDNIGLIKISSLMPFCNASLARTQANDTVQWRQLWRRLYTKTNLMSLSSECRLACRGRNTGVPRPSWQFFMLREMPTQSKK